MSEENQYQYKRIKEYIIQNINNDFYRDKKIESENTLAKKFEVSRMTVRQAILSLQQDGYVYTVPKTGTYAKKKETFKELNGLQSFSEDASHLHGRTKSRVIECRKTKIDNRELSDLGFKDEVWHVVRVRYFDDDPIVYEDSYYNGDLIKDIPVKALQSSLYAYFEDELHLDIDCSNQQIDACLAQELSQDLEVEKGMPLLRIVQKTYLNNGECLEYGYNYYRVDKYTFNQNAQRRRKGK